MDRCLYAVFLYNAEEINRRVVTVAHKDLTAGHHVYLTFDHLKEHTGG